MQRLQISFYATDTTLTFMDRSKAQAAYDKISSAIKEYRRFKNDSAETVEVDGETGPCIIKLENVNSVLFEDGSDRETLLRADYEIEKLARTLRDEMGLPDLKTLQR